MNEKEVGTPPTDEILKLCISACILRIGTPLTICKVLIQAGILTEVKLAFRGIEWGIMLDIMYLIDIGE
jgi:hypothetical protein